MFFHVLFHECVEKNQHVTRSQRNYPCFLNKTYKDTGSANRSQSVNSGLSGGKDKNSFIQNGNMMILTFVFYLIYVIAGKKGE